MNVTTPGRRSAVITLPRLLAVGALRYLIAVVVLAALRRLGSVVWVDAVATTFALVWFDSEVLNPLARRAGIYRDAPLPPAEGDSPPPGSDP